MNPMIPQDISDGVNEIRLALGDPERAHVLEDRLCWALLDHIAEGTCRNTKECARRALTSREINFPRWCA